MKKYIPILIVIALALSACAGQPAVTNTPAASQPTNSLSEIATPEGTQVEIDGTPAQPQSSSTAPAENTATAAIDCTSPVFPSTAMTEGPYYTAGTPERTSLVDPEMPGTRLLLTGYVLDTNCQPVANAWLDFWQADANGVYDNVGYTLRGHQFTDENGRYQLETVIPGQYPGRTEHIHVKVKAPGGKELTTQLYFPRSTSNDADSIFSPEMVIKIVDDSGTPVLAEFNFVVPAQ